MIGDIRGETIPTMYQPTSQVEALLGVVGAGASVLGAAVGPFAGLASMHLFGKAFSGGISAVSRAGSKLMPYANEGTLKAVTGRIKGLASGTWGLAKAAVRNEAAARNAVLKYGLGAAAAGAGAAGLLYLNSLSDQELNEGASTVGGLALGGAGIVGALALGKRMNMEGAAMVMAGVAGGAGYGAGYDLLKNRAPDEGRQAFINSSNATMARGAAGRNKRRGHA